jgi:hypothetical protein
LQSKFSALVLIALFFFASAVDTYAQSEPDPRGAFFRSLAVPGWGHYYADRDDWTRGKIHLGTDVVLIGTIFGLNTRANRFRSQYFTLSNLKAGVDVSGRDRSFQLAVGEFDSLEEYNDFQLRTRNWNRLIEDVPNNRWQWESSDDRRRFRELRSGRDQIRNQLPALGAFMVVNRVISGISALNRVRANSGIPDIAILPMDGTTGVSAHLRFKF